MLDVKHVYHRSTEFISTFLTFKFILFNTVLSDTIYSECEISAVL